MLRNLTYAYVVRSALLLILINTVSSSDAGEQFLKYQAAPAGNPLQGLVPYAGPGKDHFPFSMEFNYLPLSDLMVGPNEFEWAPLEELLNDVASRGNQTIVRIWMEYPGHEEGIPQFLIDDGLKIHEWLNTNTAPFPAKKVRTPDYEDKTLRASMRSFIKAWGAKYDGDPRLGYITAGLLGTWGEWHTYPKEELFASKQVQEEVMRAYEQAFEKTPVLLRYPAGADHYMYAENANRRFGYHDDSFAWATLDTGKKQDDWFYVPSLKAADAVDKWKTNPIGGEIRPEVWGKIFDVPVKVKKAQDFAKCVEETHVTWLMDTGMFKKKNPSRRQQNALNQVARMGCEFYVSRANLKTNGEVIISIRNTGIAPFYHPWQLELCAIDSQNKVHTVWKTDWQLTGILPTDTADQTPQMKHQCDFSTFTSGQYVLAMRLVNPLKNGKPFHFANETQNQHRLGWLTIGELEL